MSAQLASPNSFSAHLALANGVHATISAPTLSTLADVVGKLQPTTAANDAPAKAAPAPKPETKAKPEGNVPASTATQASAPPVSAGSEAPAADVKVPDYNDVKARVLALAKVSRELATKVLGQFGVDHGNKLQLEQYGAFIAAADAALEDAKVAA